MSEETETREKPQPEAGESLRDAYTFVMERIRGGVRPPNLITCFDCIIPRLAAYPFSFTFALISGEDSDTGEDFWLAFFEDDLRPETRRGDGRHETVVGAILLAAAAALQNTAQCVSIDGGQSDADAYDG